MKRSAPAAVPLSRSRCATGKVRVMASSPTYDPNLVEGNFNRVTGVRADCKRPDALLNRATAGLYAPGSIFKVMTASAAIDSGRFKPDVELRRPGLLRGLRQAGQQLRHHLAVRPPRPGVGAEVLGQLGLLQHRQGTGREGARRVLEALRLLLPAAARDAGERARRRAASTRGQSSSTRRRTPTSIQAGSPSGRSGCS